MITEIIMPKQGLQMTEGAITKWLKNVGDDVKNGEAIIEIETDKAALEIEAQGDGKLLKKIHDEGETVAVSKVIGLIGADTDDISKYDTEPISESKPDTKNAVIENTLKSSMPQNSNGRIFITPRAKKLAIDNKINFSNITGTGPNGLIIEKNITPSLLNKESFLAFKGIRKTIAERMIESQNTYAQAYHKISINMNSIINLRESLKKSNINISYNDIFIKICSKALLENPILNSTLENDRIILKHYANIGFAVAVDNGLFVPVVHNAETLSLEEISNKSKNLIKKARNGSLGIADFSSGTFTISNLGMYDLDEFTAIINPPQSAILAIGAIKKQVVAINDEVCIRPIATLCLTYDHRIIDGAPAAAFLKRVKELSEMKTGGAL